MIDLIISDGMCPHCLVQEKIMKDKFSLDEYRIITAGTEEFENYDMKDQIDAVPFIVVRDSAGHVKYADKGIRDEKFLRNIENEGKGKLEKVFNLREARTREQAMPEPE